MRIERVTRTDAGTLTFRPLASVTVPPERLWTVPSTRSAAAADGDAGAAAGGAADCRAVEAGVGPVDALGLQAVTARARTVLATMERRRGMGRLL
jgi:hypothetical protein